MATELAGKCATCAHFRNDPAYLEREIPGFSSMSSAHASIRADDGICTLHERYLSAHATCSSYQVRVSLKDRSPVA